ncbi:alpha/beta hydrolase [Streptomyces sp. RY43-2]|uniref:Alpha/beta hydrolase n=1 Tax=Streptomyces macrolidinus TaxID=2952607 RepID=A0ABT0ZMM8_9ACTN|nr:alpha/beta hydrolase [Streptomyces macrolidinus]MCN9244839.1 alpha/beta hydrolase [Streptomyces macrolidinus]
MLLAEQEASHGAPWRQIVDHEAGGEPLHVWESPGQDPRGPSLVLVHGFEENWESWLPLARRLPRDLRLFALDLPWRGGSHHRWTDRGSSATWLERALELLPVHPDAVLAHSFGATTQLELLTRSTPFSAIPTTLVAPVYRPHDQPVDSRFFGEAVDRFRSVLADGLRARMGPRGATVPPDIVDVMIGKVRERVEPQGFLHFYATLSRTPHLPLPLIEAPVLVVSGTHDPSAPVAAIDELRRAIPDVTIHQDANLDHFCQLRQPDRVAEQLLAFLAARGLCLAGRPQPTTKESISA